MELKNKLEALLFVSAKPLALKQLAELLKEDEEAVKEAGEILAREYQEGERGIALIENGGKLQMVTAPACNELVVGLVKAEVAGELTRPSLEALTIIAYRGPISKTDLDQIRGVNCAMILRNLLLRGLIEAKEDDNGQNLYSASFDFLKYLGLANLESLPDYERLHNDAIMNKDDEQLSENASE